MRIAIFHDLPSGGAKRSLHESARRLASRHTLDVYTLATADETFCDLRPFSNRHRVFPFAAPRTFGSPFGRLNRLQWWATLHRLDRLTRRIAREIDEQAYDIVFAQPCMWSQAPLVLRHVKTPAVYYCHEAQRGAFEV